MSDVTSDIMQEISSDEIQNMMDDMLGRQSFDFTDYVGSLVNGSNPFDAEEAAKYILRGMWDNIVQDRNIYIYIIVIAVTGALLTNFSKLLQGKKVADMAFYSVYMLFFSVLSVSFARFSQIACDTLEKVFDFIKVFGLSYFTCMTFTEGKAASGVFYEFMIVAMNVVDFLLIKFAMPALQFYFFLELANRISEEDMFSKLAQLIKDLVNSGVKMMFGIIMGANVVQGLVVPVAAEAKNSIIVKMGSSIPGIGNTVSSVAGTVLCAGKLVRNSVGVIGIIVVAYICVIPLLRLVTVRLMYRVVSAFIQPISDKRLVNCLDVVAETMRMQIYSVGVGAMMFVISIAVISAMT